MVRDLVGKEWTILSNGIDNELKGPSTEMIISLSGVFMLETNPNGNVYSSIMYSKLRGRTAGDHPVTAEVPKTNARFA